MKKLPLFIIIVIALSLFAAADYYLNDLDGRVVLDLKDQVTDATAAPEPPEPLEPPAEPELPSYFESGQVLEGYEVASQLQTRQIFEKIDLSHVDNITVIRNELQETAEDTSSPLFIYEIRGPENQGSLTYLNIKLQFIAQINAAAETINETSEFGQNSFFFNNRNYENTAFLLVQIGDDLFGLQYNKAEPDVYEDIQRIIGLLTAKTPNS